MSKIEIRGIYKIFGRHEQACLQAVQGGMSKAELLGKNGHTVGLRDISLSIEAGSIYVIMGLSGSGKSTLIRHFNRLIEPTAGQILVDGQDVMALGPRELEQFRQRTMSMVFQRFGLFPHRNVLENAAYGLQVQGMPKSEREAKARHWLEQVGLKGFEKQFPRQLSGGMQQRVGLARALATDADILLMDEAFSALDPLIRREMQDQLLALQAKLNKTIVFITHDLDEALRLGNRIAILKDGELVQEGAPEDILLNPANEYVQAFLQDVNRGKVLTASHALSERKALTLTTRTAPARALERLQERAFDYAPVLDGRNLRGVLTQSAAQRALEAGARDIAGYLDDVASVPASTGLDEVLGQLLREPQPLAVTGDDGEFVGWLSRKKVVQLVSPALDSAA
ncbi:quaternary amine ABC transporter ATP-binding protein [Pseudomonas turukhanskensis]|uniref:Quaternary amine transport ATP-binding protein n=1 Tax=Pseudomonas turukhanskensis TaxID=1806536 RepID=A0A9W6K2S3_9PSED|nr:glycine betaine/L-proline ABC transporter ATP-binding protein [Pseudomonas turukhanskensis]GLK86939.1 ABC transporter ATP-binding protein [Pseudomonas turukhanskensis]